MTTSAPRLSERRRLLTAGDPTLATHHRQFGTLPDVDLTDLVSSLAASGLRGRGGARFPAGRKLAAVARAAAVGATPVVVANGAEGEPLSDKDAVLLSQAPHLVLDGVELAARALGADQVYLYLPAESIAGVRRALSERDGTTCRALRAGGIVESPDTFVAGEETALLSRIEGGRALPRDRTQPAVLSGLRRRPTLVNNVETLAHIALIARFGPQWFRSAGAADDPGTMLVTLSGTVARSGVVEVPTDATVADLLRWCGATDPAAVPAVLVGGYHGRWLPAHELGSTAVAGLGIVHALSRAECGLARTAAIAGYLAAQSAGQCGPCRIGLPRLAHLLTRVAHDRADGASVQEIRRLLDLVDGRGACRHPDGSARMIRSALDTFADDLNQHRTRRCHAASGGRR